MTARPAIVVLVMIFAMLHSSPPKAQTIESLVMPGEVVESHADVESECSNCHVRFNRQGQNSLCIACHEDIGQDVTASTGFHGRDETASSSTCASCHTDHEGRDANIIDLDESSFDHGSTDFALIGKHREAECSGCHEPDTKFRDAPHDCYACHREDDAHKGFMGENCGDCHSAEGWELVEFDHDTTDYPLIGKHQEVACGDCHQDDTFQNTPVTCYGCHAEDDVHNGRSGRECETCHNPTSWNDSSFDHERDTDFSLEGRHAELTCNDCHSDDPFSDSLDMTCIGCHEEDDEHDGHFGPGCDTCHGVVLWTDVHFDHDSDTDYPLHGAHESIECEACHVEPIFDVPLESGCNDCHAADDPHNGEQGIACQDCHNELSWQDDVFFDHDLTRFPLLGAHAEVECDGCHESHEFRAAPEACVDCHREEDPHEGRFSDQCGSCHNPVDWTAWVFDHDTLTDFPLEGAHRTVACEGCHRADLTGMQRLGSRCGDCHRADDIHDGEFGADCGRCHNSDNFHDVRSIQ